MKVFLSWSGEASHAIAKALRDWLPSVIIFADPWLSSEDIEKGTRWSPEIAAQIGASQFGIICVVPGNLTEPWLNFEAGAISTSVETATHVAPLLVGLSASQIKGPLAQFQLTEFTKDDMRRLIHSINKNALEPMNSDLLNRTFDLCWPGLKSKVEAVPFDAKENVQKSPQPAVSLSEDETQILRYISNHEEFTLDVTAITRLIRKNKTRAQYYLDNLIRLQLLDALDLSSSDKTVFGLTQTGRALLVANNLV